MALISFDIQACIRARLEGDSRRPASPPAVPNGPASPVTRSELPNDDDSETPRPKAKVYPVRKRPAAKSAVGGKQKQATGSKSTPEAMENEKVIEPPEQDIPPLEDLVPQEDEQPKDEMAETELPETKEEEKPDPPARSARLRKRPASALKAAAKVEPAKGDHKQKTKKGSTPTKEHVTQQGWKAG